LTKNLEKVSWKILSRPSTGQILQNTF
jgi:hypothetical protein